MLAGMSEGDGTVDDAVEDAWAPLADRFVEHHYGSLRGRVRTYVIDAHLRAELGRPPLAIVDVGGGGGNQSLPLARDGYEVTIVDPSPAMLERAAARVAAAVAAAAADAPGLTERVRLVEATGESAPEALDGQRFDAVLCHGVVMYVDHPVPLVDALCRLVRPGGLVSIVAKSADVMAVRPALAGDWAGALAAFDAEREVNGLGLETRADRVDDLSALLAARGVDPIGWYGVRLFTDGWTPERPATDADELVLQVELEASRREPYRRLSRLFHLLARARAG
jgi:SAM-dependent methyltransferase